MCLFFSSLKSQFAFLTNSCSTVNSVPTVDATNHCSMSSLSASKKPSPILLMKNEESGRN
ncbi:hypothetical protein BVRB_9g207640 [Beta vulgaris subsp. vulgaris]|nr:hypothetical protein BVRB_9g207640 [Beta vulgaris subsp. vulgaris]